MDAIEKAIRSSFERGDSDDPAYREKVYRSVSAALEKAIASNPEISPELVERRRQGLRATIAGVETEFMPAGADEAVGVPPIEMPERRSEDRFRQPGHDDPEWHGTAPVVPAVDDFDAGPPRIDPNADEFRVEPVRRETPKRRGRFALAFAVVTVLAALGMGAYFAVETGFLQSPAERDTSVANPPKTLAEEEFQPPEEPVQAPALPGAADTRTNWITVFSPDEPTTVRAPAEASAEMVQVAAGQAIRIRSGGEGAAVLFDVGQGVLEQLAGKSAVFDIIASAEDGQSTQMSVICNFGELGDCGRKRYAVGQERAEFLFDVAMPEGSPGAAGTIAIVSDFENTGKAVDIHQIRVSITE